MKKFKQQVGKFDPRTIAIAISALVTILSGAIGISYFAGYSIRDMESRQEQMDVFNVKFEKLHEDIEEVKSESKEYVEQEVGGLRSDWERGQYQDDKRLEKLER